jgi:ferritin-like metal-binding protein YciE
MPIQSPQELLVHELHGIEDAETEASRALEGQLEDVENSQLQRLLQRRMQQGQRLLKEVQKNLEKLNGQEGGRENEAARGLIREAQQLLQEIEAPDIKEAVLIASVQKLEHYCIAVWGTVKAIAREMGEEQLAKAMERALKEGYKLDEELTRLAESRINPEAVKAGAEEDEDEDEDEEFEEEDEGEDEGEDDEDEDDEDEDEDEDSSEEEEGEETVEDGEKDAIAEERRTTKSGKSPQRQASKPKGGQRKEVGGKQAKGKGASSDLKSREYRDEKGKVHHHTREYMSRRGGR